MFGDARWPLDDCLPFSRRPLRPPLAGCEVSMSLIVLLRGMNVGGHRAFRPTQLARKLSAFDVVNIGAAGTFVVRKPTSRARFEGALRSKLPSTTQFVICDARELLRVADDLPRADAPSNPGVVRFVSFAADRVRAHVSLPLVIPSDEGWFVRVTTLTDRLAIGEYRRHMKAIGYLGQLDELLGTLVTTRSLGTINTILQVLRRDEPGRRSGRVDD